MEEQPTINIAVEGENTSEQPVQTRNIPHLDPIIMASTSSPVSPVKTPKVRVAGVDGECDCPNYADAPHRKKRCVFNRLVVEHPSTENAANDDPSAASSVKEAEDNEDYGKVLHHAASSFLGMSSLEGKSIKKLTESDNNQDKPDKVDKDVRDGIIEVDHVEVEQQPAPAVTSPDNTAEDCNNGDNRAEAAVAPPTEDTPSPLVNEHEEPATVVEEGAKDDHTSSPTKASAEIVRAESAAAPVTKQPAAPSASNESCCIIM